MKRILVSTAVLGLALTGVASASAAPSEFKITGGGQVLAMDQTTGPGTTIAFTALSTEQSTSEMDTVLAKGQLQLNDRANGTREHGEVTCITNAMPDMMGDGTAAFGGFLRDGSPFRVDVTDDGEGQDSMDMIGIVIGEAEEGAQPTDPCGQDAPEQMMLGRGNVQVHKANTQG